MTIEATVALGAADNDFTKMAADVVSAVDSENPQKILTVMTGALKFLTENEKNIPRLQEYGATKAVGDRLAPAYARMIAGAQAVVDGLQTGDADGVQSGFTEFFEGNKTYVGISADLGDIAEQAILMKRLLLK